MPLIQFLSGLNWKTSDVFPNFYVVGDGNKAEYICSYSQRNKGSKKAICDTIRQDPEKFDFHHIIEDQHLADISVDGRLEVMYKYEMPTVLMHNRWHQLAYNAILHTSETRRIYMDNDVDSILVEERQEQAIKLFQTPSGRRKLKLRVEEMKELYFQVYILDVNLRRIAMNVFDHYIDMVD